MGRRLLKGLSAVLAVVMTLTVGMLGVWSTSELSGFTGSLFHDDFSSGLAKWQGFGSPLPNIKTGSGNPAPSFNNNGDGWCDSGAYTTANFDPVGTVLECDMYVVPYPSDCWLGTTLGFAKSTSPFTDNCGASSLVEIGYSYSGGACWADPPAEQGHGKLSVSLLKDDGTTEVRYWMNDSYLSAWHRYKIAILPDRHVEFYVDDSLIYTSVSTLNSQISGVPILLGRRSYRQDSLIDNVTLNLYNPTAPTLSVPQNLSAKFTSSSVMLTWMTPQLGSSAGYAIYKGTSSGAEALAPVATLGPTATVWADTDVTLGTTYFYYIKAFDIGSPRNYSAPSSEVSLRFSNIPVLLVHGFQASGGFQPDVLWEQMAAVLSGSSSCSTLYDAGLYPYHLWYFAPADYDSGAASKDRAVYVSNYTDDFYSPTLRGIEEYAKRLKREVDHIKKLTRSSEVDIVAHSMGGLVARAYIESVDLGTNYYSGDVHTLVMLGTPNRGVLEGILASFLPVSDCALDMRPGSPFLSKLNSGVSSGSPSVRTAYYTFAGNGVAFCTHAACALTSKELRTDGLVWMPSVKLPEAVRNYSVEYADHSGLIVDENVANAVRSVLAGSPPGNTVIKTKSLVAYTGLHYQVHILLLQVFCPVNVVVKDQTGRTISSTGVNQIPGASVQVIGDEKAFCLPSDLTYTIELSAYAQGTFTLEAIRLDDSGTTPASVFSDVSVVNGYKAVSSAVRPDSVEFAFDVDEDGNGTYDYQKAPDLSGAIRTSASVPSNRAPVLLALFVAAMVGGGVVLVLLLTKAGTATHSALYYVLVTSGNAQRAIPVRKTTVHVGRAQGSDVVIQDPLVSSRHFDIIREQQSWVVRDLGSTNGTYVDGKKISITTVSPQNSIKVGTTILRVSPTLPVGSRDRTAARQAYEEESNGEGAEGTI